MPVPTDTFWNIRTLNRVFAACSIVLLGSVMYLVVEVDYNRPWRVHQRQASKWESALTADAAARAISGRDRREIDHLSEQIQESLKSLPHEAIRKLQDQIKAATNAKAKLELPAAAVKGEIGPKNQQIERATLEFGATSAKAAELREELGRILEEFNKLNDQIVAYNQQIESDAAKLKGLEKQVDTIQQQVDNLTRRKRALEEKLAKLNPTGLDKLGAAVRDAPLLDWLNPTETVQQVVLPGVRTDLNFLTVDTVDRCATCHINIDKPAFEEKNLVAFVERQLASHEKQEVDSISRPVVMLDFWEKAVQSLGCEPALNATRQAALEAIDQLRSKAGLPALASAEELANEFVRIASMTEVQLADEADVPLVRLQEWYAPLSAYRDELQALLINKLGPVEFAKLRVLYRSRLIDSYNKVRAGDNLPGLSNDPVLLGHPNTELYAEADSKHPIKTMGCTVCHEGSGEETIFQHAAHTARNIWVDEQTGTTVPDFLIAPDGHGHRSHGAAESEDTGDEAVASHHDLNLNNPTDPAPFAPSHDEHHGGRTYRLPGEDVDRHAVSQAEYWAKKYNWSPVHYMDWERPMHSLDYIESSCNKCHTEVYDVKVAAPKLFEGRQLFAQLGCVNCHAVDSLKDDLDVKKVGPSLVHLKHKLSPQMIASWVWSPKAFRPTTRMPHFFMLENNSAPVDILRTRVEVAAMTYHLVTAPPPPAAAGSAASAANAYQPEALPEAIGNAASGKALFNSVGCLACHTNLGEHGQEWIVQDLVHRTGVSDESATKTYSQMSYNQRHWYVMEHLTDRFERFGPELSAVGTKLKTFRTPEQARGWLYDWVRNPKHYSHYTTMPDLRLSEQEASDIAAYLLTQERSDYTPDSFGFDEEGNPALDQQNKDMLEQLVATLMAQQITKEMALQKIRGQTGDPADKPMATEDQLAYLGKKMIAHYGCNGCHAINGFETAGSACTNLDEWGLKDPHKLDFGYFDHAFDKDREKPIGVWKVKHEGLEAGAPQITHKSVVVTTDASAAGDTRADGEDAAIHRVPLAWEKMDELERRPWLYQKLHNTRVYDRGRTSFEGGISPNGQIEIGKPYDKLKMPKFFVTDTQVQALITFVTSVRKPLVKPELQKVVDEAGERVIRGRQLATLYNCYGCHNIEGNTPHIQLYYNVLDEGLHFNGDYDALNNAPPRLVGQGSKTQPEWLVHFLQNVHMLRPWLKARMPSFFEATNPESHEHTALIAEYFAGWSKQNADKLARLIENIDKARSVSPDPNNPDWFVSPSVAKPVEGILSWALQMDLVKQRDLDPKRCTPEDIRAVWNGRYNDKGVLEQIGLLEAVRFLAELYDVDYPFSHTPHPDITDERFVRGQGMFNEMRCYQCHAFGDEKTLLKLFLLDNPNSGVGSGAPAAPTGDGYDEYGDGSSGGSSNGDQPATPTDAAEDDDYGGDEAVEQGPTPPPAVPLTPMQAMMAKYSAPNLLFSANRLQWNWVEHWLREPALIQPGTKMPQWFPQGNSAYEKFGPEMNGKFEAQFGHGGQEQIRLLMDFLYASGFQNYTPGAERLYAAPTAAAEKESATTQP